jgi:hypothetical protein
MPASAHRDGDIHIRQVATGRHLRRLRGVQQPMTAAVFTDDQHLAAGGRDPDGGPPVHLWTIEAG